MKTKEQNNIIIFKRSVKQFIANKGGNKNFILDLYAKLSNEEHLSSEFIINIFNSLIEEINKQFDYQIINKRGIMYKMIDNYIFIIDEPKFKEFYTLDTTKETPISNNYSNLITKGFCIADILSQILINQINPLILYILLKNINYESKR